MSGPEYDDTDMTLDEFEEAMQRAEPVREGNTSMVSYRFLMEWWPPAAAVGATREAGLMCLEDEMPYVTMPVRTVEPDTPGALRDSCGNWFIPVAEQALWNGSLTEAIGFCGCGAPEDVADMIASYLEALSGDDESRPDPRGDDYWPDWDKVADAVGGQAASFLLAYICDALGYTEHGGVVHGSWRTPKGTAAMATWRQAAHREAE